jgi:hypothetical protein
MSELAYFLSVMLSLVLIGAAGGVLWLGIEGLYWLYCKITKQDY